MQKEKKGRFQKGHVPFNKGVKGIHQSPSTELKEGQWVGEGHPSWKGGEQKMKNDCNYLWDGANKRVRKPRKIYEDNFGPIPKGYVVIHSDGDNKNDDPSNLEAISRKELLNRNQNK